MADEIVLDASVAIRVLLEDQPGHAEARATLGAALERGYRILAPTLYPYEVGNVLARAHGKPERRAAMLDAAHAIVDVVHLTPEEFHRALALASEGKLTFYDATYVALADARDAIVWTEDKEILKRAAARAASTSDLSERLAKR